MFVSSFYSVYAFAYNTKVVPPAQAPTEWSDLLDDRYRDAIGTVQIGAGSYNLSLMDFLIRNFGADYLNRLGTQKPTVYDSVAVEMEALSRGEIAAATVGLNNGIALPRSGAPTPYGADVGQRPSGAGLPVAIPAASTVLVLRGFPSGCHDATRRHPTMLGNQVPGRPTWLSPACQVPSRQAIPTRNDTSLPSSPNSWAPEAAGE
nr:ABC transporter substrate-binding protein [Saccharopolyspora pogona]